MRFFLERAASPRGKLLTPFNVISIPIILVGAGPDRHPLHLRASGRSPTCTRTRPGASGSDSTWSPAWPSPAAPTSSPSWSTSWAREKYHSIVRAMVLNGFLAYVFYAGALMLDLGRPWNIINPIIGN